MTRDKWIAEQVARFYARNDGITGAGIRYLLRDAMAFADAHRDIPKFNKTWCSQCGQEFGHGDSGFSHCSNHRTAAPTRAGGERFIARDVQPWRFDLNIPMPAGFEVVYKAPPAGGEKV